MAISGIQWMYHSVDIQFSSRKKAEEGVRCYKEGTSKTAHTLDGIVMALLFVLGSSLVFMGGANGFCRGAGKVLLVSSLGEAMGLSVIYRKNIQEKVDSLVFSFRSSHSSNSSQNVFQADPNCTVTDIDRAQATPVQSGRGAIAESMEFLPGESKRRTDEEIKQDFDLWREKVRQYKTNEKEEEALTNDNLVDQACLLCEDALFSGLGELAVNIFQQAYEFKNAEQEQEGLTSSIWQEASPRWRLGLHVGRHS